MKKKTVKPDESGAASSSQSMQQFILDEWQRDVPEAVKMAAHTIGALYGSATAGVLFYGSCLRTGEIEEKILDFYVLVDSYQAAYEKGWLATANQILPPNVFYHEMVVDGVVVRSKYAVLSLQDLSFRVSSACLNVSIWARFCQPCLLLNARDETIQQQVAGNIAEAVNTMLSNLLALKPWATEPRDLWVAAFEETYAAELRSERGGKGLEIYLLDQDRYHAVTPVALEELRAKGVLVAASPPQTQPARTENFNAKVYWFLRRLNGKTVSFLRLIKASMTFDGGIDYLAWKIRRHAGVEIEVKDWMRRHPVFAGIVLFWNLRRKGAFK
ncbi:hypothetical protein [Kordiimonas aquimaris]|uniref:hypothetical protein n=1 Tax=Kordiimonas aquimaris TaxID=707591 RepID=UPI0021CE9ECD|nr:hypothetical protein [Kordiimonas aquimaris]